MGSYGIGVSRLLATLVEQHHDDRGIALPAAVAPFDAHVLGLGHEISRAAEVAQGLESAGLGVLFEDRAVRAGEKFADADLIGASLRVTVGGRLAADHAEVRDRVTGHTSTVAIDRLVDFCVANLGPPAHRR
jgi:prolyl-tRNA synthetase